MKDSGKDIKVVGVDWCRGSGVENDHDNHAEVIRASGGTLAGALHRNVMDCGLDDIVQILVAPSINAASLFANQSLAFVFIDAAHDYDNVYTDIAAWNPKLTKGGWIGGDDYTTIWPGVVKAVDTFFKSPEKWSWDSWRHINK